DSHFQLHPSQGPRRSLRLRGEILFGCGSAHHHPDGSGGVDCTRFAMLLAARKTAKPVLRGVTTWEAVTERYVFVSGSGVVAREVSVIDTWVRTRTVGVVATDVGGAYRKQGVPPV